MQCLRIWRSHCSYLPRPALPASITSRACASGSARSFQAASAVPAFMPAQSAHTTQRFTFCAPTEAAMSCLASLLAMQLQQGDCYCLEGDVGAGKSVFCREFIREARQDADLPVPSPTFLLENVYEAVGAVSIHHFDLYRLKGGRDMDRLGIENSLRQAICLVEWPQRLLDRLPEQYLGVHIRVIDEASATHSTSSSAAHEPDLRHNTDAEVLGLYSEPLLDNSCDASLKQEEEVSSLYTDQRPRHVVLAAHGVYWQSRVQLVAQLIQQETSRGDDLDGLVICSPGEI